MAKFYQLYTYWTVGLFILYLCGVIRFSILPSLIAAFVGQILLFVYILSKKQKVNYKLGILITVLHFIPIAVVYTNIVTAEDILWNIGIFIIYNLSLLLQKTDMITVYKTIISKTDVPIKNHFARILSF